MSREIILNKKNLTEEEERYINERNDLRMLREEYINNGGELLTEAQLNGEDEESEDDGVPVEEFVKTASKQEIVAELKELDNPKVTFDPKASKDELADLLVTEVQTRNA